ncbi:hypothetical protein OH492_17005 [Vibrio chagasii]|nr:hypothetical protein [Vibrio chagasii]
MTDLQDIYGEARFHRIAAATPLQYSPWSSSAMPATIKVSCFSASFDKESMVSLLAKFSLLTQALRRLVKDVTRRTIQVAG